MKTKSPSGIGSTENEALTIGMAHRCMLCHRTIGMLIRMTMMKTTIPLARHNNDSDKSQIRRRLCPAVGRRPLPRPIPSGLCCPVQRHWRRIRTSIWRDCCPILMCLLTRREAWTSLQSQVLPSNRTAPCFESTQIWSLTARRRALPDRREQSRLVMALTTRTIETVPQV